MPPARRGVLSVAAVLVGSGFLAWTVVVAVDRNDKDVFPPVLPAALGAGALFSRWSSCTGDGAGSPSPPRRSGPSLFVATLFTGLYPRVMVSSPDFANSLTVSGAASAHYTLKVISIVAAICLPLILVYQGWTYHVFRQRLGGDEPEPAPPRRIRRASSPRPRHGSCAPSTHSCSHARGPRGDCWLWTSPPAWPPPSPCCCRRSLLARIVAGAFHGSPPAALWTDVLLLALAFAARGALAWSFEVAGRRAA